MTPSRRWLAALAALGLGLAPSPAPAQQRADSSVWYWLLHHDDRRPDYLQRDASPRVVIPVPPPPPGEPPAAVRGLYLNAWVFGSGRFYNILRLVDSTEINTLVIDVKDDTGYLTYPSTVPTAVEIGANRRIRAPDVRERLALLKEKGLHPVARIVVAKDPLLAREKPEWAVHDKRGGLWRDRLDFAWVDAYQDSVWIYAADLAAEAVLQGFEEVQFDYLRFPDEPRAVLDNAIFNGRRTGESQKEAVRRNVALMRERTASLGVPFTLDVFGLTTSANPGDDLGIGQVWEDLAPLADAVLPMVYPSHYARGAYGIGHPNAQPYATVRRALEDGVARNAKLARAPRIRPYLQAFSIFRVRYTAEEIRAQIRAVEDVGLQDWVLWNARGVYPAAALRRVPPTGTGTGDVSASPDRSGARR